jgi:hypothetical protein
MNGLIEQTIADLIKLHASADKVDQECIERIIQGLTYPFTPPQLCRKRDDQVRQPVAGLVSRSVM